VLGRKDMLGVIFELLATNGADHVIGSRFWLFYTLWVLFFLGLLTFHIGNVVVIFLVQELSVLLGELPLLLQLEYRGSERRLNIEGR
jgi:hypothetical protein